MARPVLLIAGGSRGIGASTARRAGERGHDVAVNYKGNAKAAADVVERVKTSGGKAVALQGDMAVEADIVRVFDETARALGPVTHFVHSAGIIGKISRLVDAPAAMLRDVIDVNLYGGMLCAREAARRMSTARGGSGGAIVLISSNAVRPGPTDTEIHEPGRLARVTPMLPMGRPGAPDEIAEAILFLLSDAASYVSGSVLNVSGGR
jgi:NAD(P)-dependent dehydrogenase (short-subunit alcohol dehydrogenase family)